MDCNTAKLEGDLAPVLEQMARGEVPRTGRTSQPLALQRAGDRVRGQTLDDLARKWGLTRGADIQRFRQLALTGHV